LEFVGRAGEGQTRDLGDAYRYFFGEALGRVEARTDGRAALGQLHEIGQRRFDALDPVAHLRRVAGEFLSQRERRRVLGVRAPDLDDGRPALGLRLERLLQPPQGV